KRIALYAAFLTFVGIVLLLFFGRTRFIRYRSDPPHANLLAPQVPPHPATSAAMLPDTNSVKSIKDEAPDNPFTDLNAFSAWAERFLAGDASANVSQGAALAWKRRQALQQLIETNPEKALAFSAPFQWRQAMPEKITRYFEQWVDGRGALLVAVATDFEH